MEYQDSLETVASANKTRTPAYQTSSIRRHATDHTLGRLPDRVTRESSSWSGQVLLVYESVQSESTKADRQAGY